MNFQFYVEKLKASDKYKEFKKKNPDAFFCSGFFIIDLVGKDNRPSQVRSVSPVNSQNKQHFDFYLKEKKKIFSIQLESDQIVELEQIEKKIPSKISLDLDFDFKDIEKLIEKKIQKENIKNKIQKFLFSLQKIKGKEFLVGTVFISGLGIIKINIDLKQKKITDFEKKSFFDMMKFIGKKKKD